MTNNLKPSLADTTPKMIFAPVAIVLPESKKTYSASIPRAYAATAEHTALIEFAFSSQKLLDEQNRQKHPDNCKKVSVLQRIFRFTVFENYITVMTLRSADGPK